ncbi:MAG: hypothetical protein ABL308_14025 [Oceanicaulis sp.]
MRALVLAMLVLTSGLHGGAAAAQGWTREAGEGLAITAVGLHRLDTEAGPDLLKTEYSLYLEYGLTDRITLIGRGALQEMRSGEITISLDPDAPSSIATPAYGLGGLEAGARVRLARRGPWSFAVQGAAGLPGSGENGTNLHFGEGEGDIDLRLQAGRSFGSRGFAAGSAGWRNRRGEPVDEVRLDLACGRRYGEVWIYLQTYSVWSDGSAPGPIGRYSGHRAQISLAYPISRRARIQFSGLTTVLSDGMAEERAFGIALWRKF